MASPTFTRRISKWRESAFVASRVREENGNQLAAKPGKHTLRHSNEFD